MMTNLLIHRTIPHYVNSLVDSKVLVLLLVTGSHANLLFLYFFLNFWGTSFLILNLFLAHFSLAKDNFFTQKNKEDSENPPIKIVSEADGVGFLPPNYETSQQFLRSAYVHTLGLTGVGMWCKFLDLLLLVIIPLIWFIVSTCFFKD